MNRYNICNNCGKTGHLFHQCKIPITSYGIIAFRENEGKLEYLMIRRKDTFSYIEFVRGKYVTHNKEQLLHMFEGMTRVEKKQIVESTFDELWNLMWGKNCQLFQYKREELGSQKKFTLLKEGFTANGEFLKVENLVEDCTKHWEDPEWEFPKGRKNYQEKDLECAIREFEEETGYSLQDFMLIENVVPFEEIFIGSNHKSYKHKYFLAYMPEKKDLLPNFQTSEVSKIEWKTLKECLQCIRPYNMEKKNIIVKVEQLLRNYSFY